MVIKFFILSFGQFLPFWFILDQFWTISGHFYSELKFSFLSRSIWFATWYGYFKIWFCLFLAILVHFGPIATDFGSFFVDIWILRVFSFRLMCMFAMFGSVQSWWNMPILGLNLRKTQVQIENSVPIIWWPILWKAFWKNFFSKNLI